MAVIDSKIVDNFKIEAKKIVGRDILNGQNIVNAIELAGINCM